MIVTFCGHRQFLKTAEYEQKFFAFLEEKIGNESADMYLGGYDGFDSFAYSCCKKYQETHSKISLVLVTPYLTTKYPSHQLNGYDAILYPEIENKPKRYAIVYRNQFMIEQADYIVAYISHSWGGAYRAYQYGKSKGKKIYNLADFEE